MFRKMMVTVLAIVMCLYISVQFQAASVSAAEEFVIVDGVLVEYNGFGGNVIIPDGVTAVGNWAFKACKGLTSLIIPNSVTTIGGSAFYLCTGLTSVTIPNSVTTIEKYAFYGCSGLTSVTIPNSVTTIGAGAFYGCAGLTSFTIPNSVTTIAEDAFYNCVGLTSVTIPNSVTTIGERAFHGCAELISVTIPDSVTTIKESAFYDCSGLMSVTIPNSVTTIEKEVFLGCKGLTSITIPNSVTTIEEYTFYMCEGLTSIAIPSSVTTIGEGAFSGCNNLTIYSSNGSRAEEYAKENEIEFAAETATTSDSPAVTTETPSSWAVEEVAQAITAGLVPQSLQSKYTQATTRAEFCAFAVSLYENVKGEITGRTTFVDTDDINVQKLASIGVVSGVGNNRFDPNAKLTRQQAAVMLSRLAEAIGKPFAKSAPVFADSSSISSWAVDGVGAAQGAGIVSGVGDNRFAPQDSYTCEQCIITILRTFNAVK